MVRTMLLYASQFLAPESPPCSLLIEHTPSEQHISFPGLQKFLVLGRLLNRLFSRSSFVSVIVVLYVRG